MERNINIKIDIDDRAPTSYNDLIKVGDSINLTIDLLSKGESVDLKDSSVELFLKKEDGTKVEQEVIIGDSKVSCTPLNIQSTTAVGQVCGELVVESSGKQVTSSTFIFNVEGSTSSEILEESKDDIATVKSLQNTIVNVNSVVEKYKTNIEAIAGTSESIEALAQIKIYAESAVTEIETVVNTGNTLKTSLESENTRAESNIQELTNLGSESIKTHINNTDIHVAASDKTKWDSYEQLISDNTSHLNDLANNNLLINGGFRVNQRNNDEYVENGKYTVDRWRLVNWSDITDRGKVKVYEDCIEVSNTPQNKGQLYLIQPLELKDIVYLRNKEVVFSINIKQINLRRGSIFLQFIDNGVSDFKIIDSSDIQVNYKNISYVHKVSSDCNSLSISFGTFFDFGNGVINSEAMLYYANAKLEIGNKVTKYNDRIYSLERMLCKRYYQIHSEANISNNDLDMRINPTISELSAGKYGYDAEMYTS